MKRLLAALILVSACRPEPRPDSDGIEPPVTQVTAGRAGEDRDPEVDPDGRRLFYASSSYGADLDLYVRDIGSNTATRLTSLPGDERFPKVNPARPQALAFCSNASGEWQVYVMEDQSRPAKVVQVSEPGAHHLHPSWSPDGRHLVYCTTEDFGAGEWTLTVRDLAAGTTRVLEGVDGLLPEWSPAGNRIVFQRMKHRDGWLGSVWTLEYAAGEVRDVTVVFSSDEWAAINPAWSPDGSRIVFATVAKSRSRAGVQHEPDDLWIVRADGSRATRLTTSTASDGMPCWGADGRIYFVSDRERGPFRLWSVEPRFPE